MGLYGRAIRYKSSTSAAKALLFCGLFTAIPHANLCYTSRSKKKEKTEQHFSKIKKETYI